MTRGVLILGATSAIAEAVARIYALQGARLFLVARNADRLAVIANDLSARGASEVHQFVMDAHETVALPSMSAAAWSALNTVDVALVAHGTLPEQARCEADIEYAVHHFRTNAETVITCLTELARCFTLQKSGVIAVIGSVAGDRGRGSNYLYGAAKSAIEAFTSGLRARMFKAGVHVLTIKPGFVATPMTRGLPLPGPLVASPGKVGADIVKAIQSRRNVLYTPWFWRFIMLIVIHLPTALMKRSKL
jgi:short-subunit dehydrogenase